MHSRFYYDTTAHFLKKEKDLKNTFFIEIEVVPMSHEVTDLHRKLENQKSKEITCVLVLIVAT